MKHLMNTKELQVIILKMCFVLNKNLEWGRNLSNYLFFFFFVFFFLRGYKETAQHHETSTPKESNSYQPVECNSSMLSAFEIREYRLFGKISSMLESPDKSCSVIISSIQVSRDFRCSAYLSVYARISSTFVSLEFLFGRFCVGRFALRTTGR